MKESSVQYTELKNVSKEIAQEEEVYIFPTSYAQRRLWFLDRFEPGSPYYNIPAAFRLRGDFDVASFQRAIEEVIARHESLRTTFEAIDGTPMQLVSPYVKFDLPVIDLSDKADDVREKEIIRLATIEARSPFDLAKGPLFRATILKINDTDHVVLITMHHIISDGWSIGVLVNEITAHYAAFSEGRSINLPELPIQYGDFAEWQQEYLKGEVLKKQLDFWKEQIGSNPPVLELPTDRPRPAVQTNVGSSVSTTIPPKIVDGIKKLGQREGATLFMTLLAAFKVLLFRYSGQPDICIGTPIANRTRKELEGIIGIFINTLVLRTRFYDNPTFRQMLQRVRKITLDSYDNQDLPFEYLVDQLQPERDMSYPPLFQVMFILQNAPQKMQRVNSNLQMEMIEVDIGTSTFDITLSVTENPHGLHIAVEYNTDMFDRSTIIRLLEHYQNLLQNIVANPDIPVAEIPYLSRLEEHRILTEWNDTSKERDRSLCIHQLFEQRAIEDEKADAVVFKDNRLTYGELNARANKLAHYLLKSGITPETVVGVLHEKDVNLLSCVLGILKAGGTYLPLDPTYPEERLQYMLEDAGVPILLTQESLKDNIHDYSGQVISIDGDWEQINNQPDTNPDVNIDAENLAYMIYTSGSTGKAKGTMVRHSGLVNVYLGWEEAYELRTRARSHLQMASFSFDVFSGDWTRALCSGGKLVLVPRDMLLEAETLYKYMTHEQVTIAEFVPAVLRNLIQYLEDTGQKLDFFRVLIAGSDIWYVNEYKYFLSFTGPETRLINSFGLTEATIDSSYFERRDINLPGDRLVPIGKPFANMSLYILDEYFQPVAVGVRGELYVGGESLARGYFKRPDLTANRFLPNPFSKVGGERLYKTGDMARYLPDGNIEFLGRADNQVKLRGFRIELGEIESALAEHDKIKDVAVILREDKPDDKRLVAYYVPTDAEAPTTPQLRAFLNDRLPEYMVPSAFVWLDELPLTPNGKVDRRALPKPDPELLAQDIEEEYVAPRTPTEEVIAGTFNQILNVDKVGAFHNFFDLGGHSLLATQLVSRLKDNFKVEIPLRAVFETPTVAGLAMAVDKAKLSASGISAPPIIPVSRDEVLPLSFAQQRLWFLNELEPNSPFYNIPETYVIEGPLNIEVLNNALNELIRRHESLRTTFHSQDGMPYQKIEDELKVRIKVTDISNLPAKQRDEKLLAIVKERALEPISIDYLPLFNLEVVKIEENKHGIILIIHHIISDNWSTQILMMEVSLLYDAFLRGEPSPLPELPIQYADFAYWQRNWLQGEVLEKQLGYWKNQLSGLPPVLELPTDRPRPAVQTFNGSYKTFRLSPEVSERIKKLAKDTGTTIFMALLAAFQTLLHRYAGQDDIAVGSPIANRNRAEVENLIGFFVNTLVLRGDLSGNPSFKKLLQRVREMALGAYAHQDLPFEKIVDALQPERNMSHSPLFQVMFALQSGQASDIQRPHSELKIHPLEAHSATSKFDMTLFMLEEGDHLSGALEYNTDLFDEATIERFIGHFEILLQAVTSDPDRPVDDIILISPQEEKLIFEEWNGQERKPVFDATVVKIFEQQAQKHARETALRFSDETMTYAELNERANQLAHLLIAAGVKPDMLVGLSIERSMELIIGILGILKAGGAYVPIDPSYPEERLRYILEDSGVAILVTRQAFADKLPAHNAKTVLLDGQWYVAQKESGNPEVKILPDHPAYMIYTSGSTGLPKGTKITHRGLTNYLNWCYLAYPLDKGCGSIVHSTIAFDATVTAVFTPILSAKTITLIPESADLEALAHTLRKYKDFSLIKITPAHLDLLSQQIPKEEAAELTHAFIIGGENLTADQIRFWQKYAPQTKLFNEYGPTETVVGCVVYEALKWRGNGSVPIGRAIINTRVYVLDEALRPTPVGVAGELYISGEGVARCYHSRPELTAERFLSDPFSKKPGARMYKTGDLVRYQNDGNLIFLDRVDTQVKIRGYRIELGEIESVLVQMPEIEEAVVIAHEETPGEKRLAAYFVANKDSEADASTLRGRLKQQLPEYMVPAFYIPLKEIPLTPNGKVDRKALPKPDYAFTEREKKFEAPRNQDEQMLADIWKNLLQLEQVGIHDNFFDIGGHSLLATQMMARIRDTFNVELPLTRLFETPTIGELALAVEEARLRAEDFTTPPLIPVPREGDMPLSYAQQRLWFLDQLSPNNAFYNIPAALRLKGRLNVPVLEKTINEIVRRHESLRTLFTNEKGKPKQIILPELKIKLKITDLSKLKPTQREKETMRLVSEDAQQPFKLDTGPLFRVSLIKQSDEEYVILFNMHHIISDGWSTNVLMREVAVLYSAFDKGLPSPLPELAIQYADYAAWQRSWLKDDVLQKQLDYWKNEIGVNPPPLHLPTDFPRPAVQTFNGDTVHASFSKEVSEAVKELSQRQGTTVFMTLLAAFQTFLHLYSRQDEILIGSPIANRTHSETEALIGFFVNTLVLKADVSDDPPFNELLKRTRHTTLGAYAHQDIPFEQLVDELQPERDMSHSPLFQVMFVLQNSSSQGGPVETPAIRMEALESDSKTAKFDLTLMMLEDQNGFLAEFEYNSDLFKQETVQRMIRHFENLLTQLAQNPHLQLSGYSLIDKGEEKLLLEEWNRTRTVFPDNTTIHKLFEERVAKTPDAPAVVFEDLTLSFSEINSRANQLAHYLIELGVRPEQLVGISLERSVEMVVALLAVLKAGGVYVPIDPAYPKERIRYIIEDAGMSIMLTQSVLAEKLADTADIMILLDQDLEVVAARPQENPDAAVLPENLAYMIYTSGSTGKPKGTMLQHRGLCNLTMAQIKDFELFEGAHCLQFASFSFDASVSEIFTTLISGAALYLAPREKLLPGPGLVQLLKDNEITTVTLPPSVSALLKSEDFPHLRTLVSAGEACSHELAEQYYKDRKFINAYGPTENTVCASSYHVRQLPDGGNIPIGKPIDNVQLYILDNNLNPLPIGVPGELHIGGVQLARGYFKRPALTAEKFIPNPFSQKEGERLYKSGDLARWLPDGNIEFLGRIDQQVKVRGFRIELGEIENTLAAHPAVENAVVIAREDTPGDVRLAAYYVSKKDAEPNAESLRALCKAELPDYMVPSTFTALESIPLTANGKVDRGLLPKPEVSRSELDHVFIAPRTPQEEQLALIFEELLHVEKVGINDSFFELGGHSLLATQLASRIHDAFEVDVPLITVFESPTVSELTLAIEQARHQKKRSDIPPLQPVPRDRDLPLSFAQQRLWFLDQLMPDNPSYNLPMALRVKGEFDLAAFEESLNAIVMRHESLRTTFANKEGNPVQVIAETMPVEIEFIDFSGLSEKKRESETRRIASEDTMEPFDLEIGPLFRTKVIKLADNDHVVLFNMHHIISDGWSMNILVGEFAVFYDAFSAGNPARAQLPPLAIQYADFAHWQRQWLKDEALDEQINFWKEKIGLNPEPLNLPTDFPRPSVQTFNGHSEAVTVPADVLSALKDLSKQEGVTLFMTLLAAFQTLLHRYTNQDEILVGSPIASRTHTEIEKLIGFFVNNLVLKAAFKDDLDFRSLLKQIRTTTLEAYAHQDLPFEQLVEILQPERDMSHAPIFQVAFVMQNTPMGAMELSTLKLEPVQAEQRIAKYDLSLIAMEGAEGLYAEFEYNSDLFRADTIRRMLSQFIHLLKDIVSEPDKRVDRLALMPEGEIEGMVKGWNKTKKDFPHHICIQHLFEQAVEKWNDKPALLFEKRQMTYAELNKQSNQLAGYLRERGVGPEQIVAVSLERSLEMIVAILGILKAGGAYLPVDPAYPQERIRYILEDAGVGILLTQKTLEPVFKAMTDTVIILDDKRIPIKNYPETNPEVHTSGQNLAYVIYTSGSTGRPKGTMLSHKGLVNLALSYRDKLAVQPGDRSLQFASFSFDASVEEIFTSLISGGTLVLIKREELLSGTGLIKTLKTQKINQATLPPSLLTIMDETDFPHLRSLISAGEACPPEVAKRWAQNRVFRNGYGPTENTVCTTLYTFREQYDGKNVPIGTPIYNVQTYILDKNLTPLPIGVPGELYIAGNSLARGYLKRPELTAERFIPNPFSEEPGQRMYKSGDLCRYLADGNIEFLGRIDQQIKIRGFRVELEEIESVIRQYKGVRDVVVNAQKTESNDLLLVSYLVVEDQRTFKLDPLKNELRKTLADYMIPPHFIFMDAIPLTPNGKVDYRALPQPKIDTQKQELVKPRTPIEARLAIVWGDVLNKKEIGVTSSFFDLGGHSLLAMKLLTQIEKSFGKDVNLVEFFQNPTVEHMAKMISEDKAAKSTLQLIKLRDGSDEQPLFFVHPSGGGVHHYSELAKLLDTNRAVYGIQAEGLSGKTDLHKTVEEMASAYISEIIKKQPQGTYLLAGWSLGVIIAHEMARQLKAMGREVGLLIQFDQGPYIERQKPEDNAAMLAEMFQRYFKTDVDYLRTLSEEEQFKYIIKKAKKAKAIPRFIRLADFKRYIVVNETQINAWLDYQPKPLQGSIQLYRSEENKDNAEPYLGWKDLVDDVEIIDVPGNHITMLQQPHVETLANKLSRALKKI